MIPHMAIETVKRRVCDVGGNAHDVESVMTYRLGIDGKLKRIDLCGACAQPILDLWRKSGATVSGPKIATLDEIAKKRVSPRPPAKRKQA